MLEKLIFKKNLYKYYICDFLLNILLNVLLNVQKSNKIFSYTQ